MTKEAGPDRQIPLLQSDPDTMSERAASEPEEPPFVTVEGGPSVRLSDYYTALAKTLDFFGKINKSENFQARFRGAAGGAEEDDPIVRTQFAGRYGGMAGANEKFDESEETKDTLVGLARDEFAKAFGRDALIASGIKTERAVNISMERYYTDFKDKFAGIPNKDARKSYKAKMGRRAKRFKQAEER